MCQRGEKSNRWYIYIPLENTFGNKPSTCWLKIYRKHSKLKDHIPGSLSLANIKYWLSKINVEIWYKQYTQFNWLATESSNVYR